MGRGRDHAAASPVAFENETQSFLGGRVEGRGRLVEEPEGPLRHQQPGERHPAALAGREIGHRQAGRVGEPHRLQGVPRLQCRVSEEVAGEGQVLLGSEGGFEGVPMAHIVQALGQGAAAGLLQENRPGCGMQPSGQDVEERGLAGPVAAGDHQGLAGSEGKRDPLEDAPLPPLAGQIVNAQTQTSDPCPHCTPEPF